MFGNVYPISGMAKSIKKRMYNDNDSVILITGATGSGKTTFAIQLAQAIEEEKFDISKSVIYKPENIIEQLRERPRYSCTIIDEAVRSVYSREWYSKANIQINKYFRVMRKDNKTIILITPGIKDVDSGIRNNRAGWWFHVLERGSVVMFINDFLPFSGGGFYLEENLKLFKKCRGAAYVRNDKQKMELYQKATGFGGFLRFDKLDDKILKEYRGLALKANLDITDVDESDREKGYRMALGNIATQLKGLHKITPPTLAEYSKGYLDVRTLQKYMVKAKKENAAKN